MIPTTVFGEPEGTPTLRLVEPAEHAMNLAQPLEAALAADLDGNFERLVHEYQDRLFGFALRLTRSRPDAEEIAQDAFVRAYRGLKRYGVERVRGIALRAWLYQITLNVARNRHRKKRVLLVGLDDSGLGDGAAADAAERPDRRYEEARERADLASLVAGLPKRYRAPLVLRYVEGLKIEEVAQVLRQPVGTIKSNLHRAINQLRQAISRSRRKGESR
jgi:RNA polymerase sigma-70 factor (ECF subfamily)